MNVSSIGNTGAFSGVSGAGGQDFRARMQQSMAPVAQLFGMSSDQLMSEVKASGGSLADYAASKGISNADLTAAVNKDFVQRAERRTDVGLAADEPGAAHRESQAR